MRTEKRTSSKNVFFFFHQTLYESKDNNSKEHSYHKEANTSKIAQTRIESHHILFLKRVKEKKTEGNVVFIFFLFYKQPLLMKYTNTIAKNL